MRRYKRPTAISTDLAQNRTTVSQALERIRKVAKARKKERFIALLHHMSIDLLDEAFHELKENAAAGVDQREPGTDMRGGSSSARPLRATVSRGPTVGAITSTITITSTSTIIDYEHERRFAEQEHDRIRQLIASPVFLSRLDDRTTLCDGRRIVGAWEVLTFPREAWHKVWSLVRRGKWRVRKSVRIARAAAYPISRRFLRTVNGSPRARLGVYVAYFDASEIFPLHLSAFRDNTAGPFNYYVMANCTSTAEVRRFDEIATRFGFPRVFRPWPVHEPFTHAESLQRLVDQTSDEIIVVCDVDAFPVMPGWDDFVLRALDTKDAVGAIVHFPDRRKFSTVLHPCFLAFRRSFLDSHHLDLRQLPDADPCARITEYLIDTGRFHEGYVAPLLPTAHEVQLWPDCTHARVFGSTNLRHGFGTTYGDFVLHLWFWRDVRRRRPVRNADGAVLVDVDQMEKVLASLRSKFVTDASRKPQA
jgi:hypothetical protein